jgi:phosphoglycerate kinase
LGDIYVNDAFSAAHRAHASTEGLAHILPSAAGLLMQAELEALDAALGNPARPVCAVAGGSKISTKLSILMNLVGKVDYLVLGGAMANTFLLAKGAEVGASMVESSMLDEARRITAFAESQSCTILLPQDCVCVEEIKPGAEAKTIPSSQIPAHLRAIDAGPASVKHIETILDSCKTVVWNGPLGVFEIKPFDAGTNALARAVASRTKSGALVSIAGGGDTVSALENAGVAGDFTYISTAGGAFLEWLEGKTLPGVAALMKQAKAA